MKFVQMNMDLKAKRLRKFTLFALKSNYIEP